MADKLTKRQRYICMSHNKGKDTKPELIVRKLIYSLGYRYRLHRKDLPGCPDIVFGPREKVIFVNGCYWHRHNCKKGRSTPETRKDFWREKFQRTVERDRGNIKALKNGGWGVLVVWECQIKRQGQLVGKLKQFLGKA